MALFSIADLHLSTAADKPMDIFGHRWQNYMEKLEKRWNAVVSDGDTVVVPGDISWALKPEEAVPDLQFVDRLNGKKIIGKGNHDLWWGTVSKVTKLMDDAGIASVSLLHNNAFAVEDFIIAGTRGWYVEEKYQSAVQNADFEKIKARECGRLRISLDAAMRLKGEKPHSQILVYLHFPPVFNGFIFRELVDVMHEYGIKRCFYGHIHSSYDIPRTSVFEGVNMTLISSDHLDFTPMITAFE